MRTLFVRLSWLAVCLLVTAGCAGTAAEFPQPAPAAPASPAAAALSARPADFAVQYFWSEGTLPPPYHYEYTIRLGPGSTGEIIFQPDYDSEETPVWTETFELNEGDLDRLYALLHAQGVFTDNWPGEDAPPGSSTESLQVTAAGQQYRVPFSSNAATSPRAEIYQAVKNLVPEAIWASLIARHEQYKQDHLSGTSQDNDELVTAPGIEGVIFSQESAGRMDLATLIGPAIEGYWTPTQAEVLALEERLPAYLQQAAPASYPGPLKELPAYKRQYVGVISKGDRAIFVNFFCKPLGVDWQRDYVFVLDGGSCFFEIMYNPETGQFARLAIHGES